MIVYYVLRLRGTYDKSNIEDYFLFGYFGLVFLSTVFSIDIYQSIVGGAFREEGFAAISCYIFIYFIASRYYKFSETHVKYVVITGALVASIAVVQYLGFNPFKIKFMVWNLIHNGDYSTVGHRNFIGSYFTLILPLSVFLFIYRGKMGYLIASGIIFLGLLSMTTRSSWVAFIVYIILMGYFAYKHKLNLKRYLSICLFFIVISFFFNFYTNNQTAKRFNSITKDINIILNNSDMEAKQRAGTGRVYIWLKVLEIIPEHPILGSGPDTLGITFMNQYNINNIDKAHNEYLQIAATVGIPSLLVYLGFILILTIKSLKATKNNIMMIPILCSIIGYLIQAFFNISVVSVAPIFWVLLGISGNFSNQTNGKISIKENLI
jgi:putative inorganic carbon (HCO3(-)) transporter